jgi:hypothetical protein
VGRLLQPRQLLLIERGDALEIGVHRPQGVEVRLFLAHHGREQRADRNHGERADHDDGGHYARVRVVGLSHHAACP